jgi:rhodanese-related sulfurtransferase
MKKALYLSIICVALGATGCLNKQNVTSEIQLVSAQEMLDIIEQEDVQLVDVRTPQEYNEGHIVNSQNIDYSSPNFDEEVKQLDKTKPVILYCKSGGRSADCAKKLKEAGFKKIYDLDGGISKWQHSEEVQLDISVREKTQP